MIPQDLEEKVKRSLTKHEGRKTKIYVDTVGKYTGGIGYNFSDRGIPDWFIDKQVAEDIQFFWGKWCQFSWWEKLNDDRKAVLIDFAFQGWAHVLQFKNMLEALAFADYKTVANQMLLSQWAKQVGSRAEELAGAMASGVYNV